MADETDRNELPQATVLQNKRMRISIIWIIPILSAVVALGIAIQRVMSEGPTITIVFKSAGGIEAGKTLIKFKDVDIGLVSEVHLSPDFAKVLVTAKIDKHAAGLIVKDAQFWVVEPRITLSGISGLGTVLSGNYIGFQAGKSTESERSFTGLEVPPRLADQPGRQFLLHASTLGSLGVGAPIYYHSVSVGQVAEYKLAADGKSVEITVFIDAPYDKFVTAQTRFWNASGVHVTAGAEGVDIQTESVIALLAGGLAFDAPDFAPAAEPAAPNTVFSLYHDRAIAMKQPDRIERHFVLYFDESVRGLSVGAPVTLFGLPVGQVADIGLTYDAKKLLFRPRALITFYPERLLARVTAGSDAAVDMAPTGMVRPGDRTLLRRLIEERGLRGQLKTGNLLTGELYVAFDYFPDAPKVAIAWGKEPQELPVVQGGLATMEAKLNNILTKIDAMPLGAIGNDTKNLLETLQQTLKDADALVASAAPLVPEGTKTLEELRRAIADADRALFGADSTGPQDMRDTLQEVTRAARAVRVLVEYLERHPETLVRGKTEEKP